MNPYYAFLRIHQPVIFFKWKKKDAWFFVRLLKKMKQLGYLSDDFIGHVSRYIDRDSFHELPKVQTGVEPYLEAKTQKII